MAARETTKMIKAVDTTSVRVNVLDDRAGLASLGPAGGLGLDWLYQRGAILADRVLGDVGRCTGFDDVALELLGVLQEQPRVRAHQPVRTHQERLAGLAHPGCFPLSVRGHQPVD
jgi:hypothetical protein